MRVVAALGGNALLERGELPEARVQEEHVHKAALALAPLAQAHQLVLTHGNGPQVGLLALANASASGLSTPYPFDVLGAQTQGMIGYWLLQAMQNALPDTRVACLVSRTVVSAGDPAFGRPTEFVGPVYDEAEARALAAAHGWEVRQDGAMWRRVVPSPEPLELLDLPSARMLLEAGTVVICAGGGGAPVVRDAAGMLHGAEAVVDKDLTAALLARSLDADALLLLTDVAAVQDGFGTPAARPIRVATPGEMRARPFPAGSMGPKIEAVCRFVEATQREAAIGSLARAADILAGRSGTSVYAESPVARVSVR
jgi:carbamate kinase